MARSKKEIDKELMYKKIMPTAMQNDEEPETVANAPAPISAPVQEPVPPVVAEPAADLAPAPAPTAEAVPMPAAPIAEKLADAVPSEAIPSEAVSQPIPSAAPVIEASAPEVTANEPVNIMEILLESRLDAAMDKFRCCNCDKCRKDIIAITLNKLPPYYITTQDPEKMADAESKYAGQVATALVQAILIVKSHPSH
ncbi:MAG: late competence development ComFB family protein [Oscillospiraceae bacterium]